MKNILLRLGGSLFCITALFCMQEVNGAADTFLTIDSASDLDFQNLDTGGYEIGTPFTVGASPLDVTELGALAGLDVSHGSTTQDYTAVLYSFVPATEKATVLAEVVIPTGTTVDANGFVYGSLSAPVILASGTDYLITDGGVDTYYDGANLGGGGVTASSGFSEGPGLTFFTTGVYSSGIPSGAGSTQTFTADAEELLAGNFQYTVVGSPEIPEPSIYFLLLGGVAFLAVARFLLKGAKRELSS